MGQSSFTSSMPSNAGKTGGQQQQFGQPSQSLQNDMGVPQQQDPINQNQQYSNTIQPWDNAQVGQQSSGKSGSSDMFGGGKGGSGSGSGKGGSFQAPTSFQADPVQQTIQQNIPQAYRRMDAH